MDLDLRKLRYFVAVADRLHFGRAADGRIDVGYVRLPIDEAGLRVIPLYTEPQVAVLPAGHRLAGKEQVTEAGARPGMPRGGGIAHLADGRRLLRGGSGDGRDHGRMRKL
jgi:DNA-binding transcriptional LysR family regulator